MQRSKHFKVAFIPAFLCLLAVLISACGTAATSSSNGATKASSDKQIFRYPDPGVPDLGTFDPALVQDASDSTVIQMVFTGLVQFKDNATLNDQLAASHSISSDGLTYTFKLKPDLKFSDGTSITSQDVVYSINRTLDPATKSPVTGYLSLIKDFDKISAGTVKTLIGDSLLAPSADTVVIKLSTPGAYFLDQLTYPTSYVVEKSLIDKYGTAWTDHLSEGGGDGPFKVQSYSHTTGVTLVPNANYYGAKPQLQQVKYLFSGDAETSFQAYQNHQYDWVPVPGSDVPTVKNKKDFHQYPILVIRYISMNYLAKPFDNIHIRQAFALATNKDLINSSVLKGAHTPTNHLVPTGMFGASASVTGPAGVASTTGDAAKARTLLAQGLREEGLSALPTVTFNTYSGSATITAVTSALENQWSTVLGAKFNTQTTDFDTLVKLETQTTGKTGPLQIWIGGWQADYPDPQDWLSIFFGKFADGASYNNNNYGQNSSTDASAQLAVQSQLNKADTTIKASDRLSLYNQAEQKLINDVVWIPLYQQNGHDQLSTKVHGWSFNALAITAPDDWGDIYITQ